MREQILRFLQEHHNLYLPVTMDGITFDAFLSYLGPDLPNLLMKDLYDFIYNDKEF